MTHALVIDDEPAICHCFESLFADLNCDVTTCPSAEDGLEQLQANSFDVVVLDVRLPGLDGVTALPQIRQLTDAPIVVMTAHGTLSTAVSVVEEGAFEYLPKPFELDQVTAVLERALAQSAAGSVPGPSSDSADSDVEMVGDSVPMQHLFRQIALAAQHDAPVLITGESGTGKELVAQAIHRHSARKSKDLVPVHLASLSESLLERELFGHTAGAFTGAEESQTGVIDQADGGTLFLDEIGETPVSCQIKLLRTIESGEFYPVGASRPRSSQFRLVTATNRSAELLRGSEHFRSDFFYRIATIQIHVPPLRERREDIPQLAEFFLRQCSPEQTRSLSPAALDELQQRSYPGNVRELKNLIIGAAAQSPETIIGPGALQQTVEVAAESDRSPEQQLISAAGAWATAQISTDDESIVHSALELVEPELIRAALKHCKGNRSAAAQRLGIHRETLREKMGRYGIKVE